MNTADRHHDRINSDLRHSYKTDLQYSHKATSDSIPTSDKNKMTGIGSNRSNVDSVISSRVDTTDPEAVRNTDIRILNQTSIASSIPSRDYEAYRISEHRAGVARKLAHVDVTVPSARAYSNGGPTYSQAGMGRSYPPATRYSHETKNGATEMTNTTFTMSTASTNSTVSSKRLKKVNAKEDSGKLDSCVAYRFQFCFCCCFIDSFF